MRRGTGGVDFAISIVVGQRWTPQSRDAMGEKALQKLSACRSSRAFHNTTLRIVCLEATLVERKCKVIFLDQPVAVTSACLKPIAPRAVIETLHENESTSLP